MIHHHTSTLNGGLMDIYREQIGRIVYEQKKLLEKYTGEHDLITDWTGE